MPDWKFPALLVAAMLLAMVFTYLQQRAYSRELNRTLSKASGNHLMLVSGRGRSFRGGAIVIMIVDLVHRQIVEASLMSGLTIFARFRPSPQLIGSVDGAQDRVKGSRVKAAVQMAIAQACTPVESEASHASTANASRSMRRRLLRSPNPERKN